MFPFSDTSERVVLSELIRSGGNSYLVNEVLKYGIDIFFEDINKSIAKVILTISSTNLGVERLAIHSNLEKDKVYKEAGGLEYLDTLISDCKGEFATHLEILKEKAAQRKFMELSANVNSSIVSGSPDSLKMIQEFEHLLFELKSKFTNKTSGLASVPEVLGSVFSGMDLALNSTGKYLGLPSGFQKLDEMCLGFHKTDLSIMAARVSSGKSSFVGSIAANIITKSPSERLLIFSLEMSKEQLIQRLISAIGCVPLQNIRRGRLSSNEWARLVGAVRVINASNLYIDDTSGLSIGELQGKIKDFSLKHGSPSLVCVDYLQLMTPSRFTGSRAAEVSGISTGLKATAKHFNIPLLALSQFSRAPEQRLDHEPKLSDLKESSSIEADADNVFFIYREELYSPTIDNKGVTKVIVAKQRQGPTGAFFLAFVKDYTKFINVVY